MGLFSFFGGPRSVTIINPERPVFRVDTNIKRCSEDFATAARRTVLARRLLAVGARAVVSSPKLDNRSRIE